MSQTSATEPGERDHWSDLHLANYLQSLHKQNVRYTRNEAINHGSGIHCLEKSRPRSAKKLNVCRTIAFIADTGIGWETATAVSFGIYGGRRAAGFESGEGSASKKQSEKDLATQNRDNGYTRKAKIAFEVKIAQGRDVIPQEELDMLADILNTVVESQQTKYWELRKCIYYLLIHDKNSVIDKFDCRRRFTGPS